MLEFTDVTWRRGDGQNLRTSYQSKLKPAEVKKTIINSKKCAVSKDLVGLIVFPSFHERTTERKMEVNL